MFHFLLYYVLLINPSTKLCDGGDEFLPLIELYKFLTCLFLCVLISYQE